MLTLTVEVAICKNENGRLQCLDFEGLIDTGSTQSSISENVVRMMGLAPTGKTVVVDTGNGKIDRPTYYAMLVLTDQIKCRGEFASFDQKFDVVIGMDILSQGNLSVVNSGGQTTLTFTLS